MTNKNKYILTLDIGGTNPRLAMMEILGENEFKIVELSEAKSDSNSIIPIINNFLEKCGNNGYTTNTCVISVAGPIDNNSCLKPTNAKFPISDIEIINNTHISNVKVINDFAAIGEAVATIQSPSDDKRIKSLTNILPNKNGHRGIIGPGTGLGVSYLTNTPQGFFVHESEGGHSGFPTSGNYDLLFKFLQNKLNINQVGTESLVSGQGIRHIIDFLIKNPTEFLEILKQDPIFFNDIVKIEHEKNPQLTDVQIRLAIMEEQSNNIKVDVAALIATNIENNSKANLAMRLFTVFLGSAAQSVALNGATTGGLFIAGGIASKNEHLFENEDFMRSFHDNWKPNIRDFLKQIPVYIIKDYDISFYGCARVGVISFDGKIE